MHDKLFHAALDTWRTRLPARFDSKAVDEFVRRHEEDLVAKFRDRIILAQNYRLNQRPSQVVEVVHDEPPPDESSPSAREAANLMAMQIAASTSPADMTPAQRRAVLRYSGWGGLSIDRFKGKFPEGLEPDNFALIHEYYTPTIVTESIARRICPLLPTLAGMNGRINAIEPSAGIGRIVRALSSPICPAGDDISWITVELSQVSSLIWKALRPDVKHHEMSFEKFIAQHGAQVRGRTNLIISNPPYGARGEFALEDPDKRYRKEKKAYLYFMRRGLELLAPAGLGVFLIPAAFMSGPSHKALREELLKRYHLSAAFRLPSNLPNKKGGAGKEFIPGADVVIDVIFWRARGGVLGEVDEADRFIVDGRYFAENPSHLLGREETPFEESGGKFNRYRVIGNFTGLPPLEERPLCASCSLTMLPSVPDPIPEDAPAGDLSPPLQAAVALGDRVAKYLALRAADDTEQLAQLWPELHGALKDLQESSHLLELGGNPWRWMDLVKLSQRHVRGAEEILNAFDKNGRIVAALADEPRVEPKYKGSPDDILGQANELFRQRRSLTLPELMDFHRKVGGQIKQEDALRTLLAAEWNLDGEKWNELLPLDAYTSGKELWERHDLAKKHADQGEEQGRVQVRRLLAAIKPAVFEDITDVSPQHGFVPLELVSKFVSETLNRNIGPIELEREGGLVRIKGRRYADDTSAGAAPNTLAFLGWLNHDNVLFEPYREFRDDGSGERYTIAQQRVRSAKQWDEEFRRWLAGDETRRSQYTDAYNRANRGRVVPSYPAEPLDIARWGVDSPKLRDHQTRGARRVLENRGGLIAFDVGVGKTYTAIAVIARARQEGWVRRPVIVVPSSLTWKWHDDIRCTLPDYRVVPAAAHLADLRLLPPLVDRLLLDLRHQLDGVADAGAIRGRREQLDRVAIVRRQGEPEPGPAAEDEPSAPEPAEDPEAKALAEFVDVVVAKLGQDEHLPHKLATAPDLDIAVDEAISRSSNWMSVTDLTRFNDLYRRFRDSRLFRKKVRDLVRPRLRIEENKSIDMTGLLPPPSPPAEPAELGSANYFIKTYMPQLKQDAVLRAAIDRLPPSEAVHEVVPSFRRIEGALFAKNMIPLAQKLGEFINSLTNDPMQQRAVLARISARMTAPPATQAMTRWKDAR